MELLTSSANKLNFTDILDNSKWRKHHWKIFSILSTNYFLDGLMFAVIPILLSIAISPVYVPLIFALNLIAQSIGAVTVGYLADLYGRLKLFAISTALEASSIILIIPFYRNIIAVGILTSVITFIIGGELGVSSSLITELTPIKHRGKALLLITNFWNLGGATIAILSILYFNFPVLLETKILYLILTAIGAIAITGLARITLPESPRWLVIKNKTRKAENIVRKITNYKKEMYFELSEERGLKISDVLHKYLFRFIILSLITISIYITYDIIAFYIPYSPGFAFGIHALGYVIFYANMGSFLGAFLLVPLIDKTRKFSTIFSFIGGSITSVILLLSNSLSSIWLFYSFLFINMIFSEWGWGCLNVLQSELFPTPVRSSVIGLLISLQGISGALIVYIGLSTTATILFIIVIIFWIIGTAASLAWYFHGIESAKMGIEKLQIRRK